MNWISDWLNNLGDAVNSVLMGLVEIETHLSTILQVGELYIILSSLAIVLLLVMVFALHWRQCTILSELRELRAELKGADQDSDDDVLLSLDTAETDSEVLGT